MSEQESSPETGMALPNMPPEWEGPIAGYNYRMAHRESQAIIPSEEEEEEANIGNRTRPLSPIGSPLQVNVAMTAGPSMAAGQHDPNIVAQSSKISGKKKQTATITEPNLGRSAVTNKEVDAVKSFLSKLKMFPGHMPMPSALDAPQFTGRNLLRFIDDYEMAADNVGWTNEQKCDHVHKYCVSEQKSLIKALRPRKDGDWKGTIEMMKQLYSGRDRTDKYSRDSLERLILQDRTITSKKQFVKYYRDFTKRTHNMYEEIAEDDKNRLFWKGLPRDLQKDIFSELLASTPGLNRKKAAAVKDVREIAMKIFDKNSLYAPLAISHSKFKEKKSKHSSHKKKKHSRSRITFEDSDEDTESSSEEEDKRRRRRRSYHRKSDSSSSNNSSSDDSDDESSDDEFRRMGDRKKKQSLSQQKSRRKNRRSSRNDSDKESDRDKEDDIANLTEKFHRLELMLSKRKDRKDDHDIPRDARFIKDPTYQYLARALNKVAQEAEEDRNNMNLQRDRPLPYNPPRNNRRFQCFVCHQYDTHARGSMNCPEARALVDQGYCKFIDGRLVMKDDSDMPKTAQFESLGRAIHRLYGNKLPKANGNLSRPSHVAYAEFLEPEEGESNGSDTSPAMWNHVYAVERNKKDRKDKPQFNPVNKEKRVRWQDKQDTEQRPKPYIDVPPVPKQWGKSKQPGTGMQVRPAPPTNTPKEPEKAMMAPPSSQAQVPPRILKRPHPENQPVPNRQEPTQIQQPENRVGTLGRQPNIKKSDFIVQGNPKTPNKGPEKIAPRPPSKTRYTSAMRQQFDENQVYQKVLDTNVSIPLGELIAACPKLEKSLASDTRVKTVPITRVQDEDEEMADAFASFSPQNQEDEYDYIPDFDSEGQGWQVYNSTIEHEPNQVYAARKEKEHNKEKVASSTGSFILKVGDTEVRAMVDSGAEINMITPALAEHLRDVYAEDENGKKFQIRNISGTVSSLKGRFNNVPIEIGGYRLYETFFVGDEWNSHFQVVLGQAFLQNQACEMSWEENDYINMWFHPKGDKKEAPVRVRLMRRKGVEKKGAVASLAAVELFEHKRKRNNTGNTWGTTTRRHQGVTEILEPGYIEEEEEDIMHPNNFPKQDFEYQIGEDTQDRPAKSSLSGSDDERYSRNSISEVDQTPSDSEGNEEDWLDVQPEDFQVSALQTASRNEPGRIFHKAMADFLKILKPASRPASYESAQATYNARVYKAFYQIPIGNRNLSIDEGEQQIRINNKSMRATFDAKANYNLMTKVAQIRSKLKTTTASERDDNQGAIRYCSQVEINLGQGPVLPGLFLIIDDYIPGGYDVVLGKPWMIGIEKKFAKSRFTPIMETLEETKDDIVNTSDFGEEPLIGTPYQPTDEETARYVQKKRGYYTEYADNRPKKRIKEDRLRATNREPCGYMREYNSPDIGGSITRTL